MTPPTQSRPVNALIRIGILATLILVASQSSVAAQAPTTQNFVGFDRNDYPGDALLPDLRKHFIFSGYWLNNPPGATTNSWQGKRPQLRAAGFGFLVLWNGRLDVEIKKSTLSPAALGQSDAAAAISASKRDGFPPGTILFLDQEEGGRLLPEQSAYFFAWTEAIAASPFRPGAYLSGQSAHNGTSPDGKSILLTTAQDVRDHIAANHLHNVALWVAQDTCPPSRGCTITPPALQRSGTPEAIVWQYAQSPRRPQFTRSCAKAYAADGNCYAGASTGLPLDLNVATSTDPSYGR